MGFFICWITLHLLKFQSAAIGKKKLLMYSSTPAEFFITFLTTSKKYEICLQDNLGHGFFICWITLHLLKFQSAAIRKNPTNVLVNSSRVLYYISDNFSKKVWDMLTRQLRLFLYVGLGFFLFVGLHVTGRVYLVYFSILPVHSLMFVMSIYCYFFIL